MPLFPSVHITFGAVFDGTALSLVLYGIVSAQVLKYFRSYQNDPALFKVLVCTVWFVRQIPLVSFNILKEVPKLDTIQTAFVMHMLWHYLIERGENGPTFFLFANWSLISQIVPTEITVVIVESFFIMKMWRHVTEKLSIVVSERNKLTLLPVIPMLSSWGHSIAYVVDCFRFPAFLDSSRPKYTYTMFAGSRALTDISIATTMCYLLFRRRSMLPPASNSLMKALLSYTLTTGLLTSIFTTACLILYLAKPLSMIWIGVYIPHGKIYANSMLASLNARNSLRILAHKNMDLDSFTIDLG